MAQASLKHVIVLCGLLRAGIIGLCYQILCGDFDVQRLSFVSRVLGPGTYGLGNSCLARPDRTLKGILWAPRGLGQAPQVLRGNKRSISDR